MGLIQSVIAVIKTSNPAPAPAPAPTPVTDTSSDTVEPKSSSDSVKAVELVKEPTTEPTIVKETIDELKPVEVKPDEVKPDKVKPDEVKPIEVKSDENVPQTPTVPVADNISANERYVTPVGTKVEVAPVNVTPNADVVKKNKKHKKNKN